MHRRNPRFGVTGLLLALGLVLALPGAAIAQTVLGTVTTTSSGTFTTRVTIPSGTAAGIYDIVATGTGTIGSAYPPSGSTSSTIAVSRSLVIAGSSLDVFGSGWTPNTTVTLRLELVNLAEASFSLAQVTETRTARARIRVIRPGANFLFGGFVNPPAPGVSNPIIINNNNSSSSSSSAAASAGGGTIAAGQVAAGSPANAVTRGLARTGVPALPLLAVGVATILLGSVLVSAGRRRTAGQTSFSG